uniref:Ribosomal protein L29 n=1 Tax=Centroceras clavulatum TaxID=159503 RepID=A0A4D6WSD2_9FLOR|nr:ribosomal protein L29 [Centroceras clavulatum]
MNLTNKDNWQNLTINDIQEKITNIRKEIIFIKIKQKTQQTIKPNNLKKKKHILAQLLTLETLKLKQQ